MWEKVRAGPAYHLVRQFGITADTLAQNAEKAGRHRLDRQDALAVAQDRPGAVDGDRQRAHHGREVQGADERERGKHGSGPGGERYAVPSTMIARLSR